MTEPQWKTKGNEGGDQAKESNFKNTNRATMNISFAKSIYIKKAYARSGRKEERSEIRDVLIKRDVEKVKECTEKTTTQTNEDEERELFHSILDAFEGSKLNKTLVGKGAPLGKRMRR